MRSLALVAGVDEPEVVVAEAFSAIGTLAIAGASEVGGLVAVKAGIRPAW